MIFCFVRETKQLTLEEIDQVFSIPTKTFINYELKTMVPYWLKKNILRRKLVTPPPIFARDSEEEENNGKNDVVHREL